jgi:hypothetical protein
MRWVLIVGNIAAAIGLVFLGNMAVAAHRTHSYSMYRELQTQGVLNERPDYDVKTRLEAIAAGGSYSERIAWCGAGACLINAAAMAALSLKPSAHD